MIFKPESPKANALLSRLARSASGLSIKQVAVAAKVSTFTMHRLEAENDRMRPRTLEDIQRVYEQAGVRFVEDGDWVGVMVLNQKSPPP